MTWSTHGLELKQRYEEKRASQQAHGATGGAAEGPTPIFKKLVDFTEEIEHEGEKIPVISPYKIRLQQLKNPPSSIQGTTGTIFYQGLKSGI